MYNWLNCRADIYRSLINWMIIDNDVVGQSNGLPCLDNWWLIRIQWFISQWDSAKIHLNYGQN